MNPGPTVFAQILAGVDHQELARAAARFPMPRASRALSAYDHFTAMVFAQLTYREGLRDIEACLQARADQLYHIGIRGNITRTNLAYANEHRDWRIFAEVAAVLMRRARRLYQDQPAVPGLEVDLFALDTTVIELCLALCPWARWQGSIGAVKLSVLLDLRGDIPVFASIDDALTYEVVALDRIPVTRGSYYVMDRGFVDFSRFHRLAAQGAYFVSRFKRAIRFRVVKARPVDRTCGLRCDQLVYLTERRSRRHYPEPLRRIRYFDIETGLSLVFVTNQLDLPALTIASLYKRRWQIELFFRWIKQHLRLHGFFSYSPNGVRVQIWSALCAHLLIAIAKQRCHLPQTLYQILQVVSVSAFEKVPLPELFTNYHIDETEKHIPIQLEISGF
jgi:hypothetical protein